MADFDDLPQRAFAPRLTRMQGDDPTQQEPYSTADILAGMPQPGFTEWMRTQANKIPESGRHLEPRGPDEGLFSYWKRMADTLSIPDMVRGGIKNTADWLEGPTKDTGQRTAPGEGYSMAMSGLDPTHVITPLGLAPMGALVGHSASLAKPSIADSARARYLEWKHPDDFPAISGGEGQFNSAKYLAEKDRMTHDNPHSIRSAAEPIATDPSATVINQYARNLYGTHNDVLNRINDLLKQAPSPERDAALAQYRQMRFRTASLLDELDPPEFSPANERGTPRDRFRLLAENDSTAGNIINSLPMDEASRLNRAREMGFDTDNVAYRGLSRPYDDAEASKLYYQMFTSSPAEAAEYAMGNPLAKPNVVPTYLRKGRNLEVDASNQNFNAVPTSALPDDIRAKLRGDVARTDEIAHAARGLGYDSVTIKNVIDNATNEVIQAPKENPALKAKRAAEMDAILAELGDLGDLPPAPAAVSRGYEGVAPHERGPVTVNAVFDPKNIRSKYAAFNPLDSDKAGLLLSDQSRASVPGTVINSLDQANATTRAATGLGHPDSVPGAFQPIRAYHGTTYPDLKFQPHGDYEIGPHFGTAEQANARLEYSSRRPEGTLEGANVLPVDLHIRNPLEIKDAGMFDAHNLPFALEKTGKFSKSEIEQLQRHERSLDHIEDDAAYRQATAAFHSDLARILKDRGYDSLRYRNTSEHPEINTIMRELEGLSHADAVKRTDVFDRKAAVEKRLAQEGDFSYVPMARGTVKSATTGETLFSKSDNPFGALVNEEDRLPPTLAEILMRGSY
jgi:hypothetical protein